VTDTPSHTARRFRSKLAATALAIAALLAAPAAAQALTFDPAPTVTPASTQAGANSDVAIQIDFNQAEDDVENLRIGLPTGLVGDPNATPPCTVAELNDDNCPPSTEVGTVSTQVSLVGQNVPLLGQLVTLTVNGNLYNLTPEPGEPARFGIALHALPFSVPLVGNLLLPPIIMQSGVQLRSSDFGLDTVINGIPNMATVLQLGPLPVQVPIDITRMEITLDGTAPNTGKAFMRNPTSCGTATTTFTADAYTGANADPGNPATGQAQFTPTGCEAVPFSPSFSATVAGIRTPGDQVPLITSIDQDPGEAGLRTAQVLTPGDFGANIPMISTSCPADLFRAGACPPQFVVGSAVATSPLLSQPLTGPVIMVQSDAIPNIGLDLNGPLHMLLQGSLGLDNAVKFDGLPDIPISHFELRFDGAPQGLLTANRDLCLPPAPLFHENFGGYNGATTSLETPSTVVNCGPKPATAGKCAKAKKKGKKGAKHRAAEAKKKKGAKKCKKKGKRRKQRR
jgi:hypothetical protein